jgi:hypothetical protein
MAHIIKLTASKSFSKKKFKRSTKYKTSSFHKKRKRMRSSVLTIWSIWPWDIKRKSWEMARWGHRPISNANFKVGKMMHVSWPPIEIPSTWYPSTCKPLLFLLFDNSMQLEVPAEEEMPLFFSSIEENLQNRRRTLKLLVTE